MAALQKSRQREIKKGERMGGAELRPVQNILYFCYYYFIIIYSGIVYLKKTIYVYFIYYICVG